MALQSLLFGAIASLGFGFSDLLAAVVSRRVNIINLVLGADLAAVLIGAAYLPFAPSLSTLSLAQWGQIGGLGVSTLVLTMVFYTALRIGPVAVVTPIVSANTVVVILLAVVFLGERLGLGQSLGAGIAIVGVVLSSTDLRRVRAGGRPVSKGVLIGLVVLVGGGLWTYYIGILSKELGWFLPVYLSRIVTVVILLPVQVARGRSALSEITAKMGLTVAVVGILETGGMFALARGMEVGVVSIVATTLTLYPVVPILGGIFMFREKLALNQMAGLALVLAGLVALGLTS